MGRTSITMSGLAALTLLAGCQASAPTPEPAPAPAPAAADTPEREPSVLDGIFTLAQAERGEEVFTAVCSECHDTADYTDEAFLSRWNDKSVYQLYYQIHDTMPYGAPSSLTRQQYTDVLTYIFHLNGMPTGDTELGSDDDSLDDFWVHWLNGA